MSGAREPDLPIASAMPQPPEPEACFISMAWDRAGVSDSIDGVRMRLEPGWTVRILDDRTWIVNEDDPDRFEFAMQLRRVDLAAISPLDFLRLELLLSRAQGSRSDLRWGPIERVSPTRWHSTASGHRRAAGLSLMGSSTRHWYHTRSVDSDYVVHRVLVTSPDAHRGILISYTDTAAIQAGRNEAERIVDSIEVQQNGRGSSGRADAIAASLHSIDSNPIDTGDAYLRLACALVHGRLFDEGAAAFAACLSLMKERSAAAPAAVASAYLQYGFALLAAFRFRDAVQALRAGIRARRSGAI